VDATPTSRATLTKDANRIRFLGCLTNASAFGDAAAFGGAEAANYKQAAATAVSRQSKYLAVARSGDTGCAPLMKACGLCSLHTAAASSC
jgi:hypothetical protein